MGLKFSALDKLISLMKSADYYLDSKTNQEIEERKTEDNKLQQQITTNKTEQDNKFKNYYDKTEVDQLVVYYGDGADSLTVPINADQLEGHPASYFIDVDSNLQDSIAAEQTARTESDSNLQEQISRNKTNIESESSTRASKDSALENAITKEISNRQTAISNESSARAEAIFNEQTIRATTDTALSESIAKEVSDRQDANTNLYNILYLGLYIDEDGDICQR